MRPGRALPESGLASLYGAFSRYVTVVATPRLDCLDRRRSWKLLTGTQMCVSTGLSRCGGRGPIIRRKIRQGTVTRAERRMLFAFQTVLACGAVAFAIITVVWRDWIEIVFSVDPDKHSGSLEWLIVAACLAIAMTCGAAARSQWRRLRPSNA